MPQLVLDRRPAVNALDALEARWQCGPPEAARAAERLRCARHGDLPRWRSALAELPCRTAQGFDYGDTVVVGDDLELTAPERKQLTTALAGLRPWRKGPFRLFGVHIDSEWRSDWKWRRIAPHVDLADARVLDVGCGNGYYGWRMLAAGAAAVTGIDPGLLFVLQHAAVSHYLPLDAARNLVLPYRLEDFQPETPFDAAFSMGVLYHRRDPGQHLRALADVLHPGGTLVLETLISPEQTLHPDNRYANMKNIGAIPNLATLQQWLDDGGFEETVVADVTTTTTAEQRSTAWMPHYSLAEALDARDASRTVEGYPSPTRAVIIGKRRR